jgi:hypothetical protein
MSIIIKEEKSFPKKTIVRETGFVSSGTMVPLSNSLEILFIAIARAKRKNPKPPTPKVMAKFAFSVISVSVVELRSTGSAKLRVANTNAITIMPKNFFFRIVQSIS